MTDPRLARKFRDFLEENGRAPTPHERYELERQVKIEADTPAPGSPEPERRKSILEILAGL